MKNDDHTDCQSSDRSKSLIRRPTRERDPPYSPYAPLPLILLSTSISSNIEATHSKNSRIFAKTDLFLNICLLAFVQNHK